MEDDEDTSLLFGSTSTPARVSLAPFSTPSRRLSSRFSEPSRAVPSARKKLAWISLQGRLIGANEATSAKTIRGGLSREEAAAWELFSPLQRILIVALVAVAASESKRARKIAQLQRSVNIRDEVLLNMQQKLDDLCERLNSSKDQSVNYVNKTSPESDQFKADVMSERKETEFCSCGRLIPQLNPESGIALLCGNLSNWSKDAVGIESGKNEIFKTSHMNIVEPEERRMSDMSDFSSVTSSVDIQLITLAQEQDFYNLRKECEEKDATIKELTAAAHASSAAGSKRILELEEIIRRKNMVITKLKKDMVVLEQKVIQLMRLQRPSTTSNMGSTNLPVMANNLLYDMSSTSPSSSDSDTPVEHRELQSQVLEVSVKSQPHSSAESSCSSNISTDKPQKQQSVRAVKENLLTHRGDSAAALRPKRLVSSSGESKRTRRRTQQESNCTAPQKRWI